MLRGGWLPDYVRGRLEREAAPDGVTRHLMFIFADHWEPSHGGADERTADARLADWLELYPRAAAGHRDADGHLPAHTFFYPYDELRARDLRGLAELSSAGYGEVELHLHHRDDTSASLGRKLRDAVGQYGEFGCLGSGPGGDPAFGFVHGNWALDNSRQDGGRNYCGVDDELTVLREAGCYADFTFPAPGTHAQPRWANRLIRAVDDPRRPKSYDRGVECAVGRGSAETLLLVPGPLHFHCGNGRPRLDDGQITGVNVPRPDRVDAWVRAHVHVRGRPEWTFVKVSLAWVHGPQSIAAADAGTGAALDGPGAPLQRRRPLATALRHGPRSLQHHPRRGRRAGQ